MARPTKLTHRSSGLWSSCSRRAITGKLRVRRSGSTSTFYRWLARGEEEPTSIFGTFRRSVERAEAEAEVEAVAVLRTAVVDDWHAAVTYLERRHPSRWRSCPRSRGASPPQSESAFNRPDDYVFTTAIGTPEHACHIGARALKPALERASLRPVRWHDLRHTFASLLIAGGANITFVSRQLGHTSSQIRLGVLPTSSTARSRRGRPDKCCRRCSEASYDHR
jgi:integrase